MTVKELCTLSGPEDVYDDEEAEEYPATSGDIHGISVRKGSNAQDKDSCRLPKDYSCMRHPFPERPHLVRYSEPSSHRHCPFFLRDLDA